MSTEKNFAETRLSNMLKRNIETKGRLLAKLVWELLKTQSFETLADLTDALKARCARLRIRWTPDDINDAYRLISSNTSLVNDLRFAILAPPKPRQPSDEPPPIGRREASALVATLFARVGRTGQAVKTVPGGRWIEPVSAAEQDEHLRLMAAIGNTP